MMTDKTTDPFPQPQPNVGGAPCGECHIQPGETCDICGAIVGTGDHQQVTNPETTALLWALPWPCTCDRTTAAGCKKCADAEIAVEAKAAYWRDHPIKQHGEWGRAIFETAKAAADYSEFGDAWRTYSANSAFSSMPDHDRALIRVAFVAGWRARASLP